MKKFSDEALKRGPPKRYGERRTVNLRLPMPLYQAIREATQKSGRSLTGEIEHMLAERLGAGDAVLVKVIEALNQRIGELHAAVKELGAENIRLRDDLSRSIIDDWRKGKKT